MNTDRPAGETAPEQKAAPGTPPAPAEAAPEPAVPGGPAEAAAPGERADAGSPGGPEEEALSDSPEETASPGSRTADERAETASSGSRAEAAGTGEAQQGAGGSEGARGSGGAGSGLPAPGGKATAAALAAAVRAVESGERSAASFFTEAPRVPAARPTAAPSPAGPAGGGRPPQGAPEMPGGAPARAAAPSGERRPEPAAPPRPLPPTAEGIDGVRQVLAAGGAPEALAGKAAEVLGERAGEALREDPWQLLAVPGVRPEQADTFARALLGAACGPGDERRAVALVGWLLEQAALAGHSALEAPALRAALAQRAVPDPDEALQHALAEGAALVFQDPLDTPGPAHHAPDDEEEAPVRVLLGLDRYAMAEESVAEGLARLLSTFEAAGDGARGAAPDGTEAGADEAEVAGAEAPAATETEPGAAAAAGEAAPGAEPEAPEAEAGIATAAAGPEAVEAVGPEAGQADAGTTPEAQEAGPEAGDGSGGGTEAAPASQSGEAADSEGTDDGSGTPAVNGGTTPASSDGDGSGENAPAGPARPSAAAWEAAASAAPSPSAGELIRAVAGSGLVAHTGAEAARAEPAALVAAARALGLRAYAATHTGNGRARLAAQLTGQDAEAAVTVAGLLSGQEGPGRDADGALALDLLVVLDAPQLDLETAAVLIESLADGVRLVLSGDPGVLWSAGPGRLFADLLAARCCPQIASRTPDPGPVGELVSGIGIGELNPVEAPGKEVVIVPVRDAPEAVHRTVQLVADSVPRALGVPPRDTQVITVGHGGSAGTRALNAALKERLNPGPGRFGGFDPGDRVAYSPAPGRTVPATVTGADAEGLRLDCGGTALVIDRARVEAGAVRHGWALTAHQATGMRWPAAVVVLPGDAAQGLNRAWVYTAFSRGERHLSVVQGVDQALPRAVADIPAKERTTRLRALLQQQNAEPPAETPPLD
ncbi:helix-hairpin-helix domain-containing protein [Streptomyces sp. BBFR2]|uniref:helix-hairpin-helix domain-containing protein n=1 Tax=Streptomyces sp. BBFR2 TaxID=3372854 RepID=UPI0037DA41CC